MVDKKIESKVTVFPEMMEEISILGLYVLKLQSGETRWKFITVRSVVRKINKRLCLS